ncbi:predicted protein [Histoplasma capsulatum G186AR]|uniref:Uncharacterized protein n=1 Tax=Ajellomyces capsulatus (strain G186AR / H82 / ATCC MYA-2454 / RMSCC 2432) TaxID=447093 RepID=C0NXB6_AJECG|nr:uncharacterized protein HCBG_08108 [Histoplasma capsulatum G186AR]EEH03982.1 predicted protein [Histoplasma capsulatum G186AR]
MDLVLGTSCEPIELARELEKQSSQGTTMHQRRSSLPSGRLRPIRCWVGSNCTDAPPEYLVRGRYTTTGQLCTAVVVTHSPGHTLNWNWVSLATSSIAPFASGGFQGRDISRVRSPSALARSILQYLKKRRSFANLSVPSPFTIIGCRSKPFDKLSLRAPAMVQAQTLLALYPERLHALQGWSTGSLLGSNASP